MVAFSHCTMRIYISSMEDSLRWREILPLLQFHINNSKSALTWHSPNKLVKGFTPNDLLTIIADNDKPMLDKMKARLEAHDAM